MGKKKTPTNEENAANELRERLADFSLWPPVNDDITPEKGSEDLANWVEANDRDTFIRFKARVRNMEEFARDNLKSAAPGVSDAILKRIESTSNDDAPRTDLRRDFVKAILKALEDELRRFRNLPD